MMGTAFFILSKIVGLLLLVESWLFLGSLFSLIALFSGAIVPAKWLLAITFVILALALSPLTDVVLARLETAYPANPDLTDGKPVDGILVLGGSIITSHSEHWQQPEFNHAGERVTEAVRLARLFPDCPILISGGNASPLDLVLGNDGASEAEMTRDLLVEMGVPSERILIETKSRNTAENALFSSRLMGEDRHKRWVLVTSGFHMLRAMNSFETAGWTDLIPDPVDHRTNLSNQPFSWYPGGKLERADLTIKELVGLLAYHLTGR
ncbi:YdcF family protein [uncultured Cohaesibacter sp.]|uniref:YdcF family protein n=1 Tax=uncultured Cohaesibacter sp. TaxID=1002546 RepID=UPI0029C5FE84|nr:YdcF family protein [uncultured Cohaesibacter sp.]